MTDAKLRELERNAQTLDDKVHLVRAYKRAGDNKSAERVMRAVLAENPGNPELARTYIENSHIPEKDQAHLAFVVNALGNERFETYLVGSSLAGAHTDIDLLVTRKTSVSTADPFYELGARYELLDLSNLIHSKIREYAGETFRSLRDLAQAIYCGSEIAERHRIQIRTTLLDISYSQEPFTQNPTTERVRLA